MEPTKLVINFSGYLIINEEEFHRQIFSTISDDKPISIHEYLEMKDNDSLEDLSISMELAHKHASEVQYEELDIEVE